MAPRMATIQMVRWRVRWNAVRAAAALLGRALRSRSLWIAAGGVAVLGPLVLSPFVDLPYLVFAVPPMVLGLATWIFMRGLDRPRAARPGPPEGGTVAVLRTSDVPEQERAGPRQVRNLVS